MRRNHCEVDEGLSRGLHGHCAPHSPAHKEMLSSGCRMHGLGSGNWMWLPVLPRDFMFDLVGTFKFSLKAARVKKRLLSHARR